MKFRLLCFGSHLLISLFIAIILLGLVFGLWYPSPLDVALGIANIFLLLLCIDVIIGPLLTLLVARQGKKTLKMDLLTIGVIQLAALTYGLYMVAQGRPVWIVYDSGHFEVVQAYEAKPGPSADAFHIGFVGPTWAAVIDSVPASVAKGDAYYRAEFLQAYDEEMAASVVRRASPLALLQRFNNLEMVNEVLKKHPEANGFIPLAAKEKSMSILINKETGKTVAIVNLSPW
jgi:hypothetical protein